MSITKREKPVWKGCAPCDSNRMTFWKRQNSGDSKRISGRPGLQEGGVDSWSREDV